MIPYVGRGQGITHQEMDALYAEADRKLAAAFTNQAPALWADGPFLQAGYDRKFYFFSTWPSSGFPDTISESVLRTHLGQIDPWFRKYDHQAFTNYAAAWAPAVFGVDGRPVLDKGWPIIRLNVPGSDATANTWCPVIWPNDSDPVNNFRQYVFSALTYSLEAHKRHYDDGTGALDYFIYLSSDLFDPPEFIHKWAAADIIIGEGGAPDGVLNFPDYYNKYNFFRFQNISKAAVTITFGAGRLSFTIAALESRCVRRTAVTGAYTLGYRYFHKPMAGDPWFMRWPGHDWSNITDAFIAAELVGGIWNNSFDVNEITGPEQDWTVVDTSPAGIYANPAYVPGKFEAAMPAGGWYPAITSGTPLGDLAFHRGKFWVVNPRDSTRVEIAFDGMASLTAKLAAAGITLTIDSTAKTFRLTANPPLDIVTTSAGLIQGAFGLPARTVGYLNPAFSGTDTWLTFPSIAGGIDVIDVARVVSPQVTSYLKFIFDGTNYSTSNFDVHWSTTARRSHETRLSVKAGLFDTVGGLLGQITGTSEVTTDAHIALTAFGPLIYINQVIVVDYPGFDWGALNFTLAHDSNGARWERRFAVPLGGEDVFGGLRNFGWPYWPYSSALGGTQPPKRDSFRVCYPRIARRWAQNRYYHHVAGEEPFFGVYSQYTSEHPLVKSWYESKPISDAALIPVSRAPSHTKTGMAFLGPFPDGLADTLARLSAWLFYEQLQWTDIFGAVSNFDARIGSYVQGIYYPAKRASVISNKVDGAADGQGQMQNQLPMELEHFNAVASVVNATASMRGGSFLSAAAQALHHGVTPGFGLGRLNFRPRTQWIAWDQLASPTVTDYFRAHGFEPRTRTGFDAGGPDTASLTTFMTKRQLYYYVDPTGVVQITETPAGQAFTLMIDQGWGQYIFGATGIGAISPLLDNYRWLSVDDAQRYHASLGIPFIFEELSVPLKFRIEDAGWTQLDRQTLSGSGGQGGLFLSRAVGFVNDEGGEWVISPDAASGPADHQVHAIRSDVGQTDYCLYQYGFGGDGSSHTQVLLDANYGKQLQERFYAGDNCPVTPTQAVKSNRVYLHRRYGASAARAVVYPRNYAKYQKNFDGDLVSFNAPGGWSHIPRIANSGLEAGASEVTDLTADENILTTLIENGVLEIVRVGRTL